MDTKFEKTNLINDFKKNGFCGLGQLINDDDIIILRRKCKLMMSQQPYVESFKELRHGVFRKPVVKEKNWSVLLNFIGLSKEVDLILEKLVSSYEFKSIMEGFFGKGYKTWAWSLRLSTTSDSGLGLHTDGKGESGVTILLDDIESSDGATAVFPGSHKFPCSSQELMTDSFPIKLLKPFLVPITGKKGEVFLFSKKTYHGRLPNYSGKTKIVIFMATYSTGYSFNAVIPPENVLDNLGPELNRMMNQKGLKDIGGNLYKVINNGEKKPFIDTLYLLDKNRNIFWNLLKIYPLFIVRPVK
jgi:putative 2OG-Fe(II) oxygenase